MTYQIAICDDEKMMIKINSAYLESIFEKLEKNFCLISFLCGESLLEYAAHNPLDIVFLDIDMSGINGLETAQKLRKLQKNIVIVFITAHKEYALDAFDVDAVDYLIKPLVPDKIEKTLKKAIELVIMKKKRIVSSALTITTNNIKIKIQQYKIIYIEKIKNQCIIHTLEGEKSCYISIKEILKELESYFWQINQGVIINSNYILKIEGEKIFLKNHNFFIIGRKYKQEIKNNYYNM